MLKNIGITIGCLFLFACGASQNNSNSQTESTRMGGGAIGLTAKVHNTTIRIHLKGMGDDVMKQWETGTTKAVMSWVDAIRPVSSKTLASTVTFVKNGEATDATVSYQAGQFPMTTVYAEPLVQMGADTGFPVYNVLLHELGHAFGLGDTYVGGASGNCSWGQPQSVMCNTSFSKLTDDDTAGVQAVYKDAFPANAK